MKIIDKYDVLIIGGGISGCVFVSNLLKDSFIGRIALIEAGRGLGGRSSTRTSRNFKGWELNHGSPNFNICNKSNDLLLKKFIDQLLQNNLIADDKSDLIYLDSFSEKDSLDCLEFAIGKKYISLSSMSKLSQNIIALNNLNNQIDYYFETFICDLEYTNQEWTLISNNGTIFKSKYLVCSSNLLLHKRSLKILNKNEIPIRKAIPINKNFKIDSIINILKKQLFITRLTFLIYTKSNYCYKDRYAMKFRYFYLDNNIESKYKFERIVFQQQNLDELGIVIHTKNKDLINEYFYEKNENIFKQKLIERFNIIFENNTCINQLSGDEEISIMKWRSSQPAGAAVPISLQFCSEYNIGFCGDWLDEEGFGRVEGAISSALKLASKFRNLM